MAVERDRPYNQFNFLIDLGTGSTEGVDAGFQEAGNLDIEVDVTEYRNGNEVENAVRKITGMAKYADLTLKRGVIGYLSLYSWMNELRNGSQDSLRDVAIHLQNEDHTAVVMTWKLSRARITKYSVGSFNAKSSEVMMEELTLAYERLDIE